jgi:hypothetical protein
VAADLADMTCITSRICRVRNWRYHTDSSEPRSRFDSDGEVKIQGLEGVISQQMVGSKSCQLLARQRQTCSVMIGCGIRAV